MKQLYIGGKIIWGDIMKINLIPSVKHIEETRIDGKIAVVIDVLRATSVITTALNNGAVSVTPVIEIEDALKLRDGGTLLGGERKGLKIDSFDLANSPLEYTRERVAGKRIVLTTTNGTIAINKSMGAEKILIGSMLNGESTARKIIDNNRDTVIVCSGTAGMFSLDDFICAGKIIYEVKSKVDADMDDFAATAYMAYRDNINTIDEYIKMAGHYKYLVSIGLKKDIEYCFKEDVINIVPEFKNNSIIIGD